MTEDLTDEPADQWGYDPDHEPSEEEIAADDELRAQLRTLDPAASLPAADPSLVARLIDDTVSDDVDHDIPETRQTGVHERSRLTWLVAAAAVLLIAGMGAFVLLDRAADDDVPTVDPGGTTEASDPAAAPSVTTLSAPGNIGAGRCAVPSAKTLATQHVAFEGVVEEIADGTVTLSPTVFYAGEPSEVVQVEAPAAVLEQLLIAVSFEVGGRYLVSAADGRVSVCGYSGAWSPELEQLYVEAFPG